MHCLDKSSSTMKRHPSSSPLSCHPPHESPPPPRHPPPLAAGILYRAYHAMPKLTTPDGTPINAVLGFCNILNKLLLPAIVRSRIRPYVLVVFDGGHPLARQTVRWP